MSNQRLLESAGVVVVPATTGRFVAREKFVSNPSTRIVHLTGAFKAWFLPKVEEPMAQVILHYAWLTRPAFDDEIRKEIGAEREETTLTSLMALMECQPKGEDDDPLTKGDMSIFYVCDAGGILRAVSVYLNKNFDGWYVDAEPIRHPPLLRWLVGYAVFFRDF